MWTGGCRIRARRKSKQKCGTSDKPCGAKPIESHLANSPFRDWKPSPRRLPHAIVIRQSSMCQMEPVKIFTLLLLLAGKAGVVRGAMPGKGAGHWLQWFELVSAIDLV